MRYHNITKDDMLNGDGLRVVLWVSGCSHHCPGCQNPITWDRSDGLIFDGNALNEIDDQLGKKYISGITLSGGDIPEMISMYEEENNQIESQIGELVNKYMEYEGSTFKDLKNEDSVALVSLYPELKSDALVEKQIEVYIENNKKIKNLKKKQIELLTYKWWLYFGK